MLPGAFALSDINVCFSTSMSLFVIKADHLTYCPNLNTFDSERRYCELLCKSNGVNLDSPRQTGKQDYIHDILPS